MADELLSTTSQLGQVGTDVSGFLFGISPGIIAWVFGLAIVLGVIAMLFVMVDKDIIDLEIFAHGKK